MSVLFGVTEAHYFTVVEAHATRTLYLQKEQINRIGNPDDFLACDRCGTVLDLCAVVIRHHTAAVDAPAQAHVLQFRIELG